MPRLNSFPVPTACLLSAQTANRCFPNMKPVDFLKMGKLQGYSPNKPPCNTPCNSPVYNKTGHALNTLPGKVVGRVQGIISLVVLNRGLYRSAWGRAAG